MENTKEQFKKLICKFLSEKLNKKIEISDIKWSENYIESGYLDSLDIYSLLLYLEDGMSIELPLENIIGDFPTSFHELYNRCLQKK